MESIRQIETEELSQYINVFRQFLIKEGFFEHTLYSTIPYKVENTESFRLRNKLYLRYGTEPDI